MKSFILNKQLRLRILVTVSFLILGLVTISSAQLVRDGQSYVLSWAKNYTLIVLNTNSIQDLRSAEEFIQSKGGKLSVDVPNRVITGWIAPELVQQLVGKHGIVEASQKPVDESRFSSLTDQEKFLINYFNRVTSGKRAQEILESEPSTKGTMLPDVLEKGEVSIDDIIENLKSKGLGLEQLGISRGEEDKLSRTSDAMMGKVAVRIFWVESNGAVDPNQYSWTAGDVATITSEIFDGLNWWDAEAQFRGIPLVFTLIANIIPGAEEMQPYEPITHSSEGDSLWIKAIMSNLGFTVGDKLARTTAYNDFLRGSYSTDWAYCVFVGYNPLPAPSTFTDGYFAYAYLLGPYAQLLYRNDGWAVGQFDRVFAHESGHIFGACDEYYVEGYGGCDGCQSCNELRPSAVNGNCEHNCNPTPVPCMMRGNNSVLCDWTPPQIGWRTTPTPALTQWGLLVLVALLVLSTGVVLRRRKRIGVRV